MHHHDLRVLGSNYFNETALNILEDNDVFGIKCDYR